MPQPNSTTADTLDPEGSIFLPKTDCPEREFDSWNLQLLLGRGVAEGRDYDEIQLLSDELQEIRARYIGANAIQAL